MEHMNALDKRGIEPGHEERMTKLETHYPQALPHTRLTRLRAIVCLTSLAWLTAATAAAGNDPDSSHTVLVNGAHGDQLRVTAYGKNIVRIQSIRAGQKYFDDHHYEMVASHDYRDAFHIGRSKGTLVLKLDGPQHVELAIDQATLAISYFVDGQPQPVLKERGGVEWRDQNTSRPWDTAISGAPSRST
jgi:hypothetical protein